MGAVASEKRWVQVLSPPPISLGNMPDFPSAVPHHRTERFTVGYLEILATQLPKVTHVAGVRQVHEASKGFSSHRVDLYYISNLRVQEIVSAAVRERDFTGKLVYDCAPSLNESK